MSKDKKTKKDSQEFYGTLEAINYLIENGSRGDEWQEAGLLHAIVKVADSSKYFTRKKLDKMLKKAEEN